MLAVISILCVIIAIALIIMVLLQPSKSGSVGGAFGSLNSSLGSTFGSRRTLDFLSKGTTYGAILLGSLCLLSNIFFIPHKGAAGAANPITTGATVPAGSVSAPPKPKLPTGNSTAPAAQKEATPSNSAPATGDGKNAKQVNAKAADTKAPETKK